MPSVNKNEQLHELLLQATGVEAEWTNDVRANCFGWLHLKRPEKLKEAAEALAGKVRLCTVTAYAEERDDASKRRRIAYHFANGDTTITVTVPLYDQETLEKLPVPSITPWFLNADWNEREFREMFNIDIIGHPNPNRLFLDERLDAGIMTRLIPFSAMAHGAASNTLWERVLEAKGVPLEDRHPSVAVPAEPIKVEPKVTPVAASAPLPDASAPPTLASVAALANVPEEADAEHAPAVAAPVEIAPASAESVPAEPAPAPAKPADASPAKAAPRAKTGAAKPAKKTAKPAAGKKAPAKSPAKKKK